jgi:hypothetical protein
MTMARRTSTAALIGLALLAPAAFAQGPGKGDNKGAFLLLLVPVVAVPLQLLLAALFPGGVKRLSLAMRGRVESTIAWGAAVLALGAVVTIVPANLGGQPGQVLAGLVGGVVTLGAMAGGAGISLLAGRWSLRRDSDAAAPTYLAVLIGSTLLGAAMWLPIAGQLLGLALAVLSLGSIVRATVGAPSVVAPAAQPAPQAPETGAPRDA